MKKQEPTEKQAAAGMMAAVIVVAITVAMLAIMIGERV